MAIVFAAPFVLPWAGKMITKVYQARAQSSSVSLSYFEPPSGLPGSVLTLYGTGFTPTNNTVHFGDASINSLNSSDGTSMTLDVPSTLPNSSTPLPPGQYAVSVSNANGDSNAYAFTVICDSSDCGNPGTGGGPYTGPIYLCSGYYNCIEGFKVPIGSVADNQTVTVDGQFIATTTSFSFDQIPTGLHTISITVPTNWYSGFTLCVNNISCHSDIPIQGNSVSINFLTSTTANPSVTNGVVSVPAGSYIDLYWHFSQNFADFGGDPGNLGGPPVGTGTTSTSSIPFSGSGPRQAAAYTSGNTNGAGLSGIGNIQGLEAASQNVLGCNISQLVSPAVRSAINNSVPPPAADTARGGGGGGASIIVNDIGSTGPLRQYLYKIAASTRQQEVNSSVTRAANIGIGNNPAWDAVSYCLQNSMTNYISQSAKTWANTAFNGNPAFVQNLTTFLTGVSDQQAKAFFSQIRGANSNSPIQPWVYQNLVNGYSTDYSQRSKYTLNQYSSNPQAFLAGDWSQGGLKAQDHLYDPANFSYSALWMAQDELASRVATAQYDVTKSLDQGNGFFATRECNNSPNSSLIPPGLDCKTTTPGIINQQTTQARLIAPETRAINSLSSFEQANIKLNEQLPGALGDIFNNLGQSI